MIESSPESSSAEHSAEHDAEHDALVSRLRVIEDQPLDTRAEALGRVHDELRAVLETDDTRWSG